LQKIKKHGGEMTSQGKQFRKALENETPLQIPGTPNALTALLAREAGFNAIYLSGAGVANCSLGLPDLAVTTLNDVLLDARRITSAVNLPLLVDIDTGWGNSLMIARTIREMIHAGVAAVHIEDQIQSKRCGHRPGKHLVSAHEMADRLKAAVDARTDPDFVIMARTDALAVEGLSKSLERIAIYQDAGADMIFFEGATTLEEYAAVTQGCALPILANITEFGMTPLFTLTELKTAGIRLVLYPLSAMRAMNAACLTVFQTLRETGTQKNLLAQMQTREALYKLLGYHAFENEIDTFHQEGF
jgi:methylisocitrate lyase